MNFILKIVEGPNKGAEIALPEGVAVKLGKSDACDVVLADATLPEAAMTLKAAPDGVTLDGEPLEAFTVVARGATAFALGPADAAWGELKWPARETGNGERTGDENAIASDVSHLTPEEKQAPAASPREKASPQGKKKRGGCCGCLAALLLLFVVLGVLGWFFRDQAKPWLEQAKPYGETVLARISGRSGETVAPVPSGDSADAAGPDVSGDAGDAGAPPDETVARRYNLVSTNRAGRTVLVGDFATRAERLAATAEAYAAKAGVELDFADAESLRAAAAETLALVGEKELRVAAVTNRVLVLAGTATALRRTLEALAADLPKLRGVDVSGISLAARNAETASAPGDGTPYASQDAGTRALHTARLATKKNAPSLPVCGILTTPYPCLVLKSGARVMEGAPIGESVILKIEADTVTLTNSAGRFTWKP